MSQPKTFLLTFTPSLASETGLIDFFSSLFEIKKLVVVKKKGKEVHEIVLIIDSENNLEMLHQPGFGYKESFCSVTPLSVEEAETRITKSRTKLYVGAIPYGVDNIKIWNHFAHYGTLDYTYIIRKPIRNGKLGFGFVIFKTRSALEKALSNTNCIDGNKLVCCEFSTKSKPQRKYKRKGSSEDTATTTDPDANSSNSQSQFESRTWTTQIPYCYHHLQTETFQDNFEEVCPGSYFKGLETCRQANPEGSNTYYPNGFPFHSMHSSTTVHYPVTTVPPYFFGFSSMMRPNESLNPQPMTSQGGSSELGLRNRYKKSTNYKPSSGYSCF